MRSNQASVEGRFNGLDSRLDSLAKDMRVMMLTVVGFLFTLLMTIIGGGVTFLVT